MHYSKKKKLFQGLARFSWLLALLESREDLHSNHDSKQAFSVMLSDALLSAGKTNTKLQLA